MPVAKATDFSDSETTKLIGTSIYFLARFFGFAFGVNGSGGLFSSVRRRSSVRCRASAGDRKSIDLSSAACWAEGLCLVMGVSCV